MTIPIKAEGRWEEAEKALLQAARDVSIPYIDKAGKVMKAQALHQNLEEPSIEPRVQIQIVEPEKYNLVLRVTVPTRKRGTPGAGYYPALSADHRKRAGWPW
jgi:hypothetical protein